jgi:CheY-like chemotaxis protein
VTNSQFNACAPAASGRRGNLVWSKDRPNVTLRSVIDPAVLVVDDNDAVRGSFAEVLRTAGYAVQEAEDGFAALEWLRSSDVGAIFLDVYMPGLGGLELLDVLDDPPPVALLTEHEYDPEVISRRSKVAMFLQKPVPPVVLLAAAARMFGRTPELTGLVAREVAAG